MTTTLEIPPVLAFDVEVVAAVRLSTGYIRITFGGQSLAGFNDCGRLGTRDLRVKVLIPSPGRSLPDLSDLGTGWYQRWLAMDPAERGSMRTYTVRRTRVTGPDPQLDIDFVIHLDEDGRGGPASSWASAAQVGDRVTLLGPNARSEGYGGIEWRPPAATADRPVQVLLAGDETAVPAIASVLETLPEHYRGHAVLEVPGVDDVQDVRTAADIEIIWLVRGARPPGRLLGETARGVLDGVPTAGGGRAEHPLREVDIDSEILWETPGPAQRGDAPFYAWIAGEAAMVRDLRRHLVRDLGIDRTRVAFMGYWRHGRAEIG